MNAAPAPPRPPARRRPRPTGAWLLVAVFLLSLPFVTTRLYASDEIEAFSWLHSLAFDHDVSFENEYEYFYTSGIAKNPGFHATFLEETNEAGKRINFTTIGCAVLWAPFYAVGHLAALATGAPANGLSQPYIAAVAYGSAVYGLLALLLSASIATTLIGWSDPASADRTPAAPRGAFTKASLAATVVIWVGTPLCFYMYVTPGFSHACSAFAVSLLVWTWLRVRRRWSPWGAVALGLAGALVVTVREQDAFFIAGPAIDFLRCALMGPWAVGPRPSGHAGGDARASRGPASNLVLTAVAGLAAFAVGYTPQLLAYKALNGHFAPTHYETRKMDWVSPHGLQVLFSPAHGFFWWTPLALVAIGGLLWLAAAPSRRALPDAHPDVRWIAALALVMIALQAYVSGAVASWTVAGAFGQRRFVGLTPLLVLGMAALFARIRTPRARTVAWLAAAAGVWWNVGLMAQFGQQTMDRQQLHPAADAYRTFVALPRAAPALVWRYLTNRSSFYQRPQ